MKKLFFLLNPCAGTRKANRVLTDILSVFNRAGYQVSVYITATQGDAIRAVTENAAGMDLIVCCGGDGTFNETVSGLMGTGLDIPLGYIPAGSTNDFATSLGLSTNCVEAARQIVAGKEAYYDIGRFCDRYFSYVASFGVFTKASYSAPQTVKNALGHTAYVLEGIQELSQIKKCSLRLELDGQVIEDDFIFGAISNSTSIGRVLTLDPARVDLCDGKFEVLLVRVPKDLPELHECLVAIQKQRYNCKAITFSSASSIRILAEETMPWSLDGEKEPGHREILVENLHRAIRLMV